MFLVRFLVNLIYLFGVSFSSCCLVFVGKLMLLMKLCIDLWVMFWLWVSVLSCL